MTSSLYFPPVSPSITFQPSRGAPVYAGTEFVVTTHILLSGPSANTLPIAVDIRWSTVDGNISNSSRTTVSLVYGDGGNYTASLTFQPITTSDTGQYTATVTFNYPPDSMHITADVATAKYTIAINGMLKVNVCFLTHAAVQVASCIAWPTGQISALIKLLAVRTCTDWLCPLPPSSPLCTSASDTALPCL